MEDKDMWEGDEDDDDGGVLDDVEPETVPEPKLPKINKDGEVEDEDEDEDEGDDDDDEEAGPGVVPVTGPSGVSSVRRRTYQVTLKNGDAYFIEAGSPEDAALHVLMDLGHSISIVSGGAVSVTGKVEKTKIKTTGPNEEPGEETIE